MPPALAFRAVVLMLDLQGFLLYNIQRQGMTHFCPVVVSLLEGRDSCITSAPTCLQSSHHQRMRQE